MTTAATITAMTILDYRVFAPYRLVMMLLAGFGNQIRLRPCTIIIITAVLSLPAQHKHWPTERPC